MELVEHSASRAQRRLWFVEQVAPGEPLHNIAFRLDFAGRLDPAALRDAVSDLVARHESLRTTLSYRAGTLRQVVLDRLERPASRVVEVAGDDEVAQLAEETAAAPFDLSEAPLLRVVHARPPDPAGDVLIIVVHHAVSDAWSTGVLVGDLGRAYAARAAAHEPDWAPLAVQYVDFTAWQEQQAGGAQAAEDLAYWSETLADLPALDLTQGRPRPAEASHRGSSTHVEIVGERAERLAALAVTERCTPFMVLLAAYCAALGRVFGADDVAVGASVAGRPLPELAGVIGLFVDRQVLRLSLAGAPSFRDLLHRARDVVVAAAEHGSVTFDQVVDRLAPQREYGITPLAQASINLQPGMLGAAARDQPRGPAAFDIAGGARIGTGTVQHDIGLDIIDLEPGYRARLDHRHLVVEAAAAERVAEMFLATIDSGLSEPDGPLWKIPALSGAERRDADRHATGGPAAGTDAPLVGLLDHWAEHTGDAVAVRDESGTLTYAQLRARVDDLASRLVTLGVGAETPVLVAMPRCAQLPVAMYAVHRAGGAYVPVDPDAPAGHLARIAAAVAGPGDGDVLALVRSGAGPALPAGVRTHEVSLTGPTPLDPGPPAVAPRPDQAAYVLFTSGSTGTPKGVVVEHRNIAAYAHGVAARLAAPPGGRYLMVQAPTFDSTGTMLYGALLAGGELDLLSDEAASDARAFAAHLRDAPADYLKITPSHLSALLGGETAAALRPRRALILGGEAGRREVTDRLRAAGWSILAHYGPTETTVGVLADHLTDDFGAGLTSIPLGRPLPGVTARALDDHAQPVPVGTVGELYVSGDLVARGYLGGPGRTAAVFVPDPHGADGDRVYRTGDLVRPLAGGGFEFCGRTDRQVKINGFRIEPAAVEQALLDHPGVDAAVVVVRRLAGSDRLVAYVVVADPAGTPIEAIRAAAAATLPGYAVPAHLMALPALPVTRHGKVDVAALPDPVTVAAGTESVPGGRTERLLLEIWRGVLERPELGVTDDFFVAGGDSIQAIAVVNEARRRGLDISGRDLFDRPTVRGLAERLPDLASRPHRPGASTPARIWLPAGHAQAVSRLAVVAPALAEESAGGGASGAAGPPAVELTADGAGVLLAAAPEHLDDRSVAALAVALVATPTSIAAPPSTDPPGQYPKTTGVSAPGPVAAGPPVERQRAQLPADVGGSATGRCPRLELAVAATAAGLASLAPSGAATDSGPAGDATVSFTVGDADADAGTSRDPGRADRPVGVSLVVPAGVAPVDLRAAARAALSRTREVTATDPVLRLVPLPAGTVLVDSGAPPDRLVVLVAPTTVEVSGPAPDGLAGRIRDALVELADAPERDGYAPVDFPDANLDAAGLARVLESLGIGEGR